LAITFAEDFADAAEKVVIAATEARLVMQQNWWQRVQRLLTGKDETIDRTAG